MSNGGREGSQCTGVGEEGGTTTRGERKEEKEVKEGEDGRGRTNMREREEYVWRGKENKKTT